MDRSAYARPCNKVKAYEASKELPQEWEAEVPEVRSPALGA